MTKTTVWAVLPVAWLFLLAGCASPPHTDGTSSASPSPSPTVVTPIVTAPLTAFSERLFEKVAADSSANPVISPLSAIIALSMVAEGAKGDTAAALGKALGLSTPDLEQVVTDLVSAPTGSDDAHLISANAAWLDKTIKANQGWVDKLKTQYQGDVFNTDLTDPAAASAINDWVADKTNGLIPDLVDKVDPNTMALLVNALTMQATWATPFDPSRTSQGQFVTSAGANVAASFMHSKPDRRQLIDTGSATGVVMPYAGDKLSFLAVMPTKGKLSLDGNTIASLLAAARPTEPVEVTIPKFHVSFDTHLIRQLSALGLSALFSPTADLSGMGTATQGALSISDVQQKVSLSLGEQGTTASAATKVAAPAAAATGGDETVTSVTFDRAFVYAVIDQATGVPLFIGSMDDPSLAPPEAN